MNNTRSILALSLLAAVLAACGGKHEADTSQLALVATPEGALVASVNGELVTEPLLLVYAKGRGLDPADPGQRKQAMDSLVENILLAQAGIERGLTAKPEVQAELTLVRMQQLSGRALADYRASIEVTDAQVEQYYQQEVGRAGTHEWLVEHILFDAKAPAELALITAREPDTDFTALMADYQHSALQARQLGWSNATQLPGEIVVALEQLEDGEVAPVAIESSFGWHVLKRAESRQFAPPPLEQVREGARRQLLDRALAEHVEALRTKAVIASGAGPAG